MTKDNIGKIIEVEWYDAQFLDLALVKTEDVMEMEAVKCKIIGYLVYENKFHYIIAKEMWETYQFKYIHIIPKKMVERVNYNP